MRESSHAIIQALLEQNRVLLGRIAALEAEVARLKLELAAAKKNSRNSSKPPSSDIVKPPPPSGKGRRHIGGQPGHEPHFRTAFTLERLDAVHTFNPPSMTCRHCGGELHATPVADQVRQQINLRPDPLVRREYRAPAYFSAYHKYLKDNGGSAQFCLAHLVRELRFLKEHPDPKTRRYASRSLAAMRHLFRTHHRLLENPADDRRELVKAGERLWRTIVRSPPDRKAKNIARRCFLENGDSYLRFIANPKIEPTNNRAEQAIRQVVTSIIPNSRLTNSKNAIIK